MTRSFPLPSGSAFAFFQSLRLNQAKGAKKNRPTAPEAVLAAFRQAIIERLSSRRIDHVRTAVRTQPFGYPSPRTVKVVISSCA